MQQTEAGSGTNVHTNTMGTDFSFGPHHRADLPQGIPPTDRLKLPVHPFQRCLQAVGGVVEFTLGQPLHTGKAQGATVTAAGRYVAGHALLDRDFKGTAGFTDATKGLLLQSPLFFFG